MGIECHILIETAKNGAFRPGQLVAGTVRYFINKPTKIKTIDITFLGKGTCLWIDAGNQYKNEEEYVKVNRNLFKLRHDQECLISGSYEFPFEFLLPNDIPSSIKYNKYCKIDYNVIVTFVKAKGVTIINKFCKEVPVLGYIRPSSPEPLSFVLRKNLCTATSNIKVKIEAKIEKTFLTPGENIKLSLAINNNSDVPITVKVELLEYFFFTSHDKRTREAVTIIKQRSRSIVENSLSNIICVVPTSPNSYSIQQAQILLRDYRVRLVAELPDHQSSPEFEVPVVIGVRRDRLRTADVENEWKLTSSNKSVPKDFNLIEL